MLIMKSKGQKISIWDTITLSVYFWISLEDYVLILGHKQQISETYLVLEKGLPNFMIFQASCIEIFLESNQKKKNIFHSDENHNMNKFMYSIK